MPRPQWKEVDDMYIRHTWECSNEDCEDKGFAQVSPDWYQNNGTPVCSGCDTDMDYKLTEVES